MHWGFHIPPQIYLKIPTANALHLHCEATELGALSLFYTDASQSSRHHNTGGVPSNFMLTQKRLNTIKKGLYLNSTLVVR